MPLFPNRHPAPPPWYGWLVAAAGCLAILTGLGFGRFTLGMILPFMADGLDLSPFQMGLVSTANFSGYLAAVLLCLAAGPRMRPRAWITTALVLVGSSMFCMGGVRGFTAAALFYTLTGIGSGMANIPTMTLVSAWFRPALRARAAGMIVIGSGMAIVLSGIGIPLLDQIQPAGGWRLAWRLLAVLTLAAAAVCWLVIRDRPADIGLLPLGGNERGKTGGGNHSRSRLRDQVGRGRIARLAGIYFCFGASYVIYITFAVVAMIDERGLSATAAGRLWALIGLLSLLSGPLPGWLADRTSRRLALCLIFTLHSAAYLAAALPLATDAGVRLSVVLYGIVAWSVPGVMTALVSDTAGPRHTPRLFALVTLALAAGQMAGPAAAGWLTEITGSCASGFILAAILASGGAFLSAGVPEEPHRFL